MSISLLHTLIAKGTFQSGSACERFVLYHCAAMHNGQDFAEMFNPKNAYAYTKAIGGNVRQVKQALEKLSSNNVLIEVLNNTSQVSFNTNVKCQMTPSEVSNDTSRVLNDTQCVSNDTSQDNNIYINNNNNINNINNNTHTQARESEQPRVVCTNPNIDMSSNYYRDDRYARLSRWKNTIPNFSEDEEKFLTVFGKRPRLHEDVQEFHRAFAQALEDVKDLEVLVECAKIAVEVKREKDGDTQMLSRPNVWLSDRAYVDYIKRARDAVKQRSIFKPATPTQQADDSDTMTQLEWEEYERKRVEEAKKRMQQKEVQ